MNKGKLSFYRFLLVFALITLPLFEGGCSALRPSRPVPDQDQPPLFIAPTLIPIPTATPTTDPNAQPADCRNDLAYIKDLTIPDGAVVTAGSTIQKQWQVKNEGTCNWNSTYTIQLISGDNMGAASPQSIVPARGGAEGIITIAFIAPGQPGNYTSTWQAFDPSRQAFGDFFSIQVNVSAP